MVTAETAMALPVLVILALAGVAAVGVGQARIGCADAAREAARAIARGDPGSAPAAATAAAGRPVSISQVFGAVDTTVTVRESLSLPGWLPTVNIAERATVAIEPTGAP